MQGEFGGGGGQKKRRKREEKKKKEERFFSFCDMAIVANGLRKQEKGGEEKRGRRTNVGRHQCAPTDSHNGPKKRKEGLSRGKGGEKKKKGEKREGGRPCLPLRLRILDARSGRGRGTKGEKGTKKRKERGETENGIATNR